MERLPGLEVGDQLFVTHALAGLAHLGRAPEQHLWEQLQNAEWREAVLLGMAESPLEQLFLALRDVQLLRGEKWAWNLSHMYAAACEKAEAEERRGLLFSMVVLSSLDGGSVSAVDRLLKGTLHALLLADVKHWRVRLEEVWQFAPPLVTAKWRPMMAALSLYGGVDSEAEQEAGAPG